MKEIYVGNLLYSATYDEVQELFSRYGPIYNVKLIAEYRPGRPHAFAFIDMEDTVAEAAIRALDGVEFLGRTLRVEEAIPEGTLGKQI